MKSIYFLILLMFISCGNKNQNKEIIKTQPPVKTFKRDTISTNSSLLEIDTLTRKITKLPIGNNNIIFIFAKTVSTSNRNNNKIINIIKSVYEIEETKPEKIYISNKEIDGSQYLKRAFSDRNSNTIEIIYYLPKKHGFNPTIERVSKQHNPNNRTKSIYCLSIYKDNKIISRNIIGYIYYGDLVESHKVWSIDNDYIINTRTITGVAGNDESYISELIKFTISKSGQLVRYFDIDNGYYKNTSEKGKVENHLKEGIWVEIKDFDGYIKASTYLKAKYKKGIPTGLWKYYNLIDKSKKGDKLLMTEEYDKNGKLLKRNIIKD